MRLQRLEQGLVEHALAGEGTLAGRERLVFEGFQLRSDEAIGVLHRLPGPFVGRDVLRQRLPDLMK